MTTKETIKLPDKETGWMKVSKSFEFKLIPKAGGGWMLLTCNSDCSDDEAYKILQTHIQREHDREFKEYLEEEMLVEEMLRRKSEVEDENI